MEEYDKIISIIKEINTVKPGSGLTPAIMHKISLINEQRYARIGRRAFFSG